MVILFIKRVLYWYIKIDRNFTQQMEQTDAFWITISYIALLIYVQLQQEYNLDIEVRYAFTHMRIHLRNEHPHFIGIMRWSPAYWHHMIISWWWIFQYCFDSWLWSIYIYPYNKCVWFKQKITKANTNRCMDIYWTLLLERRIGEYSTFTLSMVFEHQKAWICIGINQCVHLGISKLLCGVLYCYYYNLWA